MNYCNFSNIIAIYNQTYPTAEPSFDYIINRLSFNSVSSTSRFNIRIVDSWTFLVT